MNFCSLMDLVGFQAGLDRLIILLSRQKIPTVATKYYVDQIHEAVLEEIGEAKNDMEGRTITHVGTPTEATDAANKIYVDTAVAGAAAAASTVVTDNGFRRLRNLREPKLFLDATNKGYTDYGDDLLRQSINSVSTNISYLEDFIFSKGYIKKVTLNEYNKISKIYISSCARDSKQTNERSLPQ